MIHWYSAGKRSVCISFTESIKKMHRKYANDLKRQVKPYLALLWLCFLWTTWPARAQSYRVEDVPDPKAGPSWNYVSNPDHYLDKNSVQTVNALLKQVEDSTTAQIAVVVLHSIGDASPKQFAIDLFNTWKIGQAGKDNGLLILMLIDQRRMEFETGKGMEGIMPDIVCKHIQEQYMVPYAKEGDYNRCVTEGVKAVSELLLNPEFREELVAQLPKQDLLSRIIRAINRNFGIDTYPTVMIVMLLYFLAYWLPQGMASHARQKTVLTARERIHHSSEIKAWTAEAADLDGKEEAALQKKIQTEKKRIKQQVKSELELNETRERFLEKKWGKKKLDHYLKKRQIIFGIILPGLLLFLSIFAAEPLGITTSVFYGALYLLLLAALIEKQYRMWLDIHAVEGKDVSYLKAYRLRQRGKYLYLAAVIFPVPFLPYILYFYGRIRALRRQSRHCEQCHHPMHRLSEKDDDQYLSAPALKEEQLRSVDYDVWKCAHCDNLQVFAFPSLFSKYSTCPGCHARTHYLEGSRVIQAATYQSSGTGEKYYACKSCAFRNTVSYTIPKKERSSSSSGSSGGGGGSSWGGGSSGGGGAGSSW